MGELTEFDYLLNAVEIAGQSENPARAGYAESRRALYAYVRDLEARRALPAPAAGEPEVPTECMNLVDDHGAQRWSTGAYEQLGDDTLAAEADAKAVAARRLVEAAISAYGDARAEHARRVAMEEAALIVDAEEDNAQEERYHPGLVGALAACATAIRAAAPQQGETR